MLTVTLVWGTTFAVIRGTVTEVRPADLILLRFVVAALALLPLARPARVAWRPAVELGFLGWAGYTSQAVGLVYTTASRSGFITALSVILVPLLALAVGHRVPRIVFVATALALVGVSLLTGANPATPPNIGDAWTLITAITYAIYILRLETYARRYPVDVLTAAQVWGILAFAAAWAVVEVTAGVNSMAAICTAFATSPGPVLYLGLAATALTAWLQTEGQSRVSAPRAALIYSSEPVWAALFAVALIGERLSVPATFGAGLVLVALILAMRGQPQPSVNEPGTEVASLPK